MDLMRNTMDLMKFRAWDEKKTIFALKGFHIMGECTVFDLVNQYKLENHCDLIITQYTGLKDRYGNELYCGDVVQYNRNSGYDGINFEVRWSPFRWGWTLISYNGDQLSNQYTPDGDRYNFIQLVGNVFENPDLMSQPMM